MEKAGDKKHPIKKTYYFPLNHKNVEPTSRNALQNFQLNEFWEYIDCFLLAPSILLLSIDDSFAEHRWLLGPVNQLHFPKESFPYFNGLFFSSSTEIVDNLLKQQTPATRPSWFLFDKTVMPKIRNPSVFRAVPGYVLALLKDGHQRDEISPLNGNLKERKR